MALFHNSIYLGRVDQGRHGRLHPRVQERVVPEELRARLRAAQRQRAVHFVAGEVIRAVLRWVHEIGGRNVMICVDEPDGVRVDTENFDQ